MATRILMPSLGESVTDATVSRWLKQVGDPVEEFEAILEVTTDKIDTEIAADAEGVLLAIMATDGQVVPVGGLLGWIGARDEAIPDAAPTTAPSASAPPPTAEGGNGRSQPPPEAAQPSPEPTSVAAPVLAEPAAVGQREDLGFISPIVARLAAEHQVDLRAVAGSGRGGRITKQDVLNYVSEPRPSTPAFTATPASRSTTTPAPSFNDGDDFVDVPLTAIRRSIAEHMVRSKQTSPHATTIFEADLQRVVAHRAANKAAFAEKGVNLTFTPYFAFAVAQALQAHPVVNSSWGENSIRQHRRIHIGMAVSLGAAGLMVPVIRDADQLNLKGLARAVNDLADRARNKQLKPDELQGGTFSITNHGTGGSLFATPVINQPQSAILGVGAIQKRVTVVHDAIAIRPMCYLSLSFDHRIIDGGAADGFMAELKHILENWA